MKCSFCDNEAVAQIGLPSINAKWACIDHFNQYRGRDTSPEAAQEAPTAAEMTNPGDDPPKTLATSQEPQSDQSEHSG